MIAFVDCKLQKVAQFKPLAKLRCKAKKELRLSLAVQRNISNVQSKVTHIAYTSLTESMKRRDSKVYRTRSTGTAYLGAESLKAIPSKHPCFFEDGILKEGMAGPLIERIKSTITPSIGVPWEFEPFPFRKGEVRKISSLKKFIKLDKTRYGDYSIAPARSSLRWIESIFWTSRVIFQLLAQHDPKELKVGNLKLLRRIILRELRPLDGSLSSLQKRLLSNVYFHLRKLPHDPVGCISKL